MYYKKSFKILKILASMKFLTWSFLPFLVPPALTALIATKKYFLKILSVREEQKVINIIFEISTIEDCSRLIN